MKKLFMRMGGFLCAVCLLLSVTACGDTPADSFAPESTGGSSGQSTTTTGSDTTTGNTDSTTSASTGDSTTGSSGEESTSSSTSSSTGNGTTIGTQKPTETGNTTKTTTKTTTASTTATTQTKVKKNTLDFSDASLVNLYGRVYWEGKEYASAPTFSWTNSGFEVCFEGELLKAKVSTHSVQFWNVTVDDERPYMVAAGDSEWAVLAEGLEPGWHTVKVEKSNEAAHGYQTVYGLATSEDGTFYKPYAAPKRNILFIGDSITAACGNEENTIRGQYSTANAAKHFTAYICKAFSAQSQVLAVSGMGVAKNGDGSDGLNALRNIFTRTAYYRDAGRMYDFAWKPDVVVLGLGTNDPTGGATADETVTAAKKLIEMIREAYPNAKIIWAYGVMGQRIAPQLEAMVKELHEDGLPVYWCKFDQQIAGAGTGLWDHPNVATNMTMAKTLAPVIAEATGWKNSGVYY